MLTPANYRLTRQKTLTLLDRIEKCSDNAVSLYFPPGLPKEEIATMAALIPAGEAETDVISKTAGRSSTGLAVYWGTPFRYMLAPPFPLKDKLISQGYDTNMLRSLLEQDRKLALVLLRLGSFAVGVFQNEILLDSKVGTGLVHARHRQGGSSQHRFERHRDKQIELFFTRVCAHAREKIEPHLDRLDFIRYGGERFTIAEFVRQCHFVAHLESRRLIALLDVREPKQASLEAAIITAWCCEVTEWKRDNQT